MKPLTAHSLDSKLRELERQFKLGDLEAGSQIWRVLLKSGRITPTQLAILRILEIEGLPEISSEYQIPDVASPSYWGSLIQENLSLKALYKVAHGFARTISWKSHQCHTRRCDDCDIKPDWNCKFCRRNSYYNCALCLREAAHLASGSLDRFVPRLYWGHRVSIWAEWQNPLVAIEAGLRLQWLNIGWPELKTEIARVVLSELDLLTIFEKK